MDPQALEQRMGGRARRLALTGGEPLFSRGDAPWAMFGVIAGSLRLTRGTLDGAPLTLHVAVPGGFIAEASLYADEYHCDCVAERPSTVVAFPKAPLLGLLGTDVTVAEAFARMMARQIQNLRAQVEVRNLRSASDRVLAALSLRAPADGGWFVPAETWKAFAAHIGLTHEAVYRTLRRLEAEGRLRRDGTRVTLAE